MSKNSILISQDLLMIREIMSLSQQELADALGVELRTLERWENNETSITNYNMEKIHSFAYQNSISLYAIKESLYKEEYMEGHQVILFHGAKDIIDGEISIAKSKVNNDFGQGFYCGETMEQSSLLVSNFANSSIYILKVGTQNLNYIRYNVDQDWMLTLAYFRGRLGPYKDTQKVRELKNKVEQCDFILAPIADNRMFQIIDSFIEGDLTDEQCKHCLAATNLGYQYVFRTKQALQQLEILERCYLCQAETDKYKEKRKSDTRISEDKIKIAKIQYRGKGHYIDEGIVMKKMDRDGLILCDIQGKAFEDSLEYQSCCSPVFIRRFMLTDLSKRMDNYEYLNEASTITQIYDELDEQYGKSDYGKTKYMKNELFWIGYIPLFLCCI